MKDLLRVKQLLKDEDIRIIIGRLNIECFKDFNSIVFKRLLRSRFNENFYKNKEEFINHFLDLDLNENKLYIKDYIEYSIEKTEEGEELFSLEWVGYLNNYNNNVMTYSNNKDELLNIKKKTNELFELSKTLNLDFIDFKLLYTKIQQDAELYKNNQKNNFRYYDCVDIIFNKKFLELELNNKNNLNKKVNKV